MEIKEEKGEFVEAAVRNWCGVTHYAGCACHEKRRDEDYDALLERCKELEKANASLAAELNIALMDLSLVQKDSP